MLFWRKIGLRLLCHPWMGRLIGWLYHDQVPHRGFTIQTQDLHPGIVARIFWGKYERAELDFIARYLEGDRDIVELGASIGVVTLQLLARLAAGNKCICVEAHPALLSSWRRNLTAAGMQSQAVLVHAAVDYSGDADVAFTAGQDSLSAKKCQLPEAVRVPAIRLGEIVREYELGPYTLVADIEGAEAELLVHDAEALRGCQQMVIELHPTVSDGQTMSRDALRQLILAQGFSQIDQRGPVYVFARVG